MHIILAQTHITTIIILYINKVMNNMKQTQNSTSNEY